MSQPVARRYALALYEEARELASAPEIDADVEMLSETLDGSRELVSLFRSPIISRSRKEAVLDRLFKDRVHELTMRFIRLLVSKEREDLLPIIVDAYRALKDEQGGIVEADVRTATPLSDDERDALRRALEDRSGRTVRMNVDVDPSLVGGVVVRIGDRVFDRSVRHQLQVLSAQFQERAYISQN